MSHRILALGVALCSASTIAHAQLQSKQPSAPVSVSHPVPVVSLRALLQLQEGQEARLNRLYDEYAQARTEQEVRFASRQNGRNVSLDEHLRHDQLQAQQKIADALLSQRKLAFKALGQVQRSQLLAFSQDPRFELKRDRYYQLLLLPVEELAQTPLDEFGHSASSSDRPYLPARSQASGSYGVYGGYSYGGPAYGVYGSVGRGSVGVHAGVGRGGASLGIGIGRVFGGIGF